MNTINHTKNGFKKVLYTSLASLMLLTLSQRLNAQSNNRLNNDQSNNNSNTIQMSWEDKRMQNIMSAYSTLESTVLNQTSFESSDDPNIKKSISTLEKYLGEELYHGSLAGLQTVPESGIGSIKLQERGYFAGEYLVNTAQIGAGTFNGRKYSYEKFKAESPRDFSFTWAIYANRAGYDGSNSEKSDERLKEIIYMNTGISASLIDIKKDRQTGKIIDIVYGGIGSDALKKSRKINDHNLPQGGVIENHILMPPGDNFKIPLDDGVRIAGLEQIKYFNVPVEVKGESDTIYLPAEPVKEIKPVAEADSVEAKADSVKYKRFIVMGTSTNSKPTVPGFLFGLQIKDSWDIELGYGLIRGETNFNNFTVEDKINPNMPAYSGHSEMTEKGVNTIRLDVASLNLVKHVGKKGNLGIVAGLDASILRENYVGQEDRKTWIENIKTGQIVPDTYDQFLTDVVLNLDPEGNPKLLTSVKVNPKIGLRAYINQFVIGAEYISNLNVLDALDLKGQAPSRYNPLEVPGTIRILAGINFGKGKEYSDANNGDYANSFNRKQ
jgi:hypothetical protein